MNTWFGIMTVAFIGISAVMVLIILVQRPQGGGLAGAFGGAGGGGTDTVFGGRVGDALTIATVIAFVAWLGLAVGLNLVESSTIPTAQPASVTTPLDGTTGAPVEGLQERQLPTGELQTGTRFPQGTTGQPGLQQIPADQVPEEIRSAVEEDAADAADENAGAADDTGGGSAGSDNPSEEDAETANPGA